VLYVGGVDMSWQAESLRRVGKYSDLVSTKTKLGHWREEGIDDSEAKLPILNLLAD
jgi:hypothetical protein